MPFASYSLRRVCGILWRWEAEYDGRSVGRGYRLDERHARWAARTLLRSLRHARGEATLPKTPSDLAA